MPNYSNTSIYFKGNKKTLNELYEQIKIKGLEVNDELSIPKHLKSKRDWTVNNWGTNVDVIVPNEDGTQSEYLDIIKLENNTLSISFNSFWCGPSIWFELICKRYKVSGVYFDIEGGNDFSYFIKYKNGKLILKQEDCYFSQLSIDIYGIEYFEYYLEVDDIEDIDEAVLELFFQNGYTVNRIQKIIAGK